MLDVAPFVTFWKNLLSNQDFVFFWLITLGKAVNVCPLFKNTHFEVPPPPSTPVKDPLVKPQCPT